jgi:TnpA family transposase
MQRWQFPFLGLSQFPAELSSFEVEQFFTLSPKEYEAVSTRRRPLNRLGVALQMGFLRMTGRTLNSVRMLPQSVLQHIGNQLNIDVPTLASIRALYKRKRTLYDHQNYAAEILGFKATTPRVLRSLTTYLNTEAQSVFHKSQLVLTARRWLYDRHYLLPGYKRIDSFVRKSVSHAETQLLQKIRQSARQNQLSDWIRQLAEASPDDFSGSVFEWLQNPPQSRKKNQLTHSLDKLKFLLDSGADDPCFDGLSIETIQMYGKRLTKYRLSRIEHITEPRRSLQVACFFRFTLLHTTDQVLKQLDQQILDLWKKAREKTLHRETARASVYRQLLREMWDLVKQPTNQPQELLEQIKNMIEPHVVNTPPNRAAAIRSQMIENGASVRSLMHTIVGLPFRFDEDHVLSQSFGILKSLYETRQTHLPQNIANPYAPCWQALIETDDRKSALCAYEIATLLLLRKSLRNGSVWMDHSFCYRNRDRIFVPNEIWQQRKLHYYQRLSVPLHAKNYLEPLLDSLQASLNALSEAVDAGAVTVEDGRIRLSKSETTNPHTHSISQARLKLYREMGEAQLPEILLQIDSEARFSWTMLERTPHSVEELHHLYAALLAHGTDLTPAQVVRMVPGITADGVSQAMHFMEDEKLLRKANETVLAYFYRHPITKNWGAGISASSDMMSLETSRHLWTARVDPRRRVFAVGMYSHVLDKWGIVYDQPIVLNKRQAGAAIEGAIRQSLFNIERVAVDTHGYTDFAMAISKVVGFDLCPRLAHLSERKLFVPRGIAVPSNLASVVERTPIKPIIQGWDGLIRIAASIEEGWCSATLALDRYGSDAKGSSVYNAGNALGKLIRTLYLCDFFSNPNFRKVILYVLNQGESVHALQRAIYAGPVSPKRGRRPEELSAITGSLSLLTNIIMAWNTSKMQEIVNRWEKTIPVWTLPEILSCIAPIYHQHINMRGTFLFPFDRYLDRLFHLAKTGT